MCQYRLIHSMLVCMLILCSVSCVSSRDTETIVELTVEQLKLDNNYLFRQIENVHPDIRAYIDEERYTKIQEYVRKQCIQPLTLQQFHNTVKIALDHLEEGHTFVHSPLGSTPSEQRESAQTQLNQLLAADTLSQNSYKLLENPKTCIFRYNHCGLPREISKYDQCISKMFAEIRKNNVQDLIIDVRNNGGGFSGTNDLLIRYFADKPFRQYEKVFKRLTPQASAFYNTIGMEYMPYLHKAYDTTSLTLDPNGMPIQKDFTVQARFVSPVKKPLRFSGRVSVLIGRGTYSSAMLFASTVQHYKFATLIGEETLRFDRQHYGDVVFISLPHSQLTIQVSTAIFTTMRSDSKSGTGIIPDYKVAQKKSDTKKKVDTVDAYVLNLVMNQAESEISR
ncbi:MAG: hypothetical protein ISS70_06150 [Phycisphaerae bacterium]|nr:hypothetical protein [Phycisphaerae bacterium]